MAHESELYSNANIITVDGDRRAEAMLVEDGTVSAIGSTDDVEAAAGQTVRRVDLNGATVIPGFNDCHMHVLSMGLSLQQIDLRSGLVPSLTVIQDLVGQRVASAADGDWILGRGYNQNLLAEGRHPSRYDLDSVSGSHPVLLGHTSGHVVSVNSVALKLAGITASTPAPPGGEIERDEAGEPTGVLKETARELVYRVVPTPTHELMVEALLSASEVLAAEGITSASDAATGQHTNLADEISAYAGALESGRMMTRVVLMPVIQEVASSAGADRSCLPKDFDLGRQPEWLRLGATKIFSDGALTTRTAAMREPYSDGTYGLLTWEPQQLREIMRDADDRGWQIATHAIGDRAMEEVISAYESLGEIANARHRIEHCTICDRDQVARMKRHNIVPALQPEDIAVLGDAYPNSIGDERAANNSPVGWFSSAGLPIAFSSDRPVTPGHPLHGIQAAVERQTPSGVLLGPEHRIDARVAVHHYTLGGAYATRTDHFKGTLTPGKRADFVVLDRDITRCPSAEISATSILMTVMDGHVVFDAGALAASIR